MNHPNESSGLREVAEGLPVTGAANIKHFVAAASERSARMERPAPLNIEYSTTRVVPEALGRLKKTHGVVALDRSPLSEAFKLLRNQVLLRMQPEGQNLLAITSPRRCEAKSLTAANLALAMAAEFDSAVLLIDADLGERNLQTMMGLEREPGLSDYLLDHASVSDLMINPGVNRLVFLPAGQAVLNSAELLATKATQHLFQELKLRYTDRYIIVDLPPLLDTSDALSFMPRADALLLVVEENKTSLTDIEQAADLLAPFNLIGTVLDKGREEEPDAARPWYRRMFA